MTKTNQNKGAVGTEGMMCDNPPEIAHSSLLKRGVLPALVAGIMTCAGCASSGGTSPPPPVSPPPPPLPPTAAYETAEYKAQWGLGAIKASNAYVDGWTGDGVTIGVLDLNHVLSSNDVDYHPDSVTRDQSLIEITKLIFGELPTQENPEYTHGLWVSEWATGNKDNVDFHGVAYDAEVLALDVWSGVNSRETTVNGIPTIISDPWTYMLDRGVRIANMSLGSSLRITDANVINHALYPAEGVSQLYLLESAATYIAGGGLAIYAAGNTSGENPVDPQLTLFDTLSASGALENDPGGLIIVGAVNKNNQIADFSERAGRTAENFVVAPGVDVQYVSGGEVSLANGTSAAAPHVAGLAAILMQQSPELSANEIADIIFETAIDLGAPGVDAIYGHGMINIKAAIAPVGPTHITSAIGALLPVTTTALVLPPAFGDAVQNSAGFAATLMQDSYGRTYNAGLTNRVYNTAFDRTNLGTILNSTQAVENSGVETGFASLRASYTDTLRQARHFRDALPMSAHRNEGRDGLNVRLRAQFNADIEIQAAYGAGANGFVENAAYNSFFMATPALRDSYGGYADNQRALGISYQLGETTNISMAGSMADYDVNRQLFNHGPDLKATPHAVTTEVRLDQQWSSLTLRVGMGVMREDGAIIGSQSAGALKMGDGATTSYSTITATWNTAAGQFFAVARGGISDISGTPRGLITGLGRFSTSSLMAGYVQNNLLQRGDAFGLAISQPLRVERGSLSTSLPVSGNYRQGSIKYQQMNIDLSPSGREVDVEMSYRWQVERYQFFASTLFMRQYGHSKANGVDAAFILQAKRKF